jgi:hypothetical protein
MRQATSDAGGRVSRRRLLRRSGATLAAGAGAASAGCLSFLPPASRTVQYGPVDVPSDRLGDASAYRRWFPAESALPDLGRADGYDDGSWMYVTPGDLGGDELGSPFDIGLAVLQSLLDYVGHGIDEFDALVGIDAAGVVAEGAVDRTHVRETLAGMPYDPTEDYRSFDAYERTDRPKALLVGDDAIVQSTGENRRAKAEVLVDTAAGDAPRRHETDAAFRKYTDVIGAAPSIMDAFGLLEDATYGGLQYTFDDDSVYFTHEHVFPAGETPTEDAVRREVSGLSRGSAASRVELGIDDPYVTIELQLDEAAFDSPDQYRSTPFVTWAVDDGADAVTLRHVGGDSIPVAHLEALPAEALRGSLPTAGTIDVGDELVFDRDTLGDRDLELVFAKSETNTVVLFHYDPNENDTTT